MIFIVGSAEIYLSLCLLFGYYMIPLDENVDPSTIVNEILFSIGFVVELLFWLITRIMLGTVH